MIGKNALNVGEQARVHPVNGVSVMGSAGIKWTTFEISYGWLARSRIRNVPSSKIPLRKGVSNAIVPRSFQSASP